LASIYCCSYWVFIRNEDGLWAQRLTGMLIAK
jgi:hypothetical protein